MPTDSVSRTFNYGGSRGRGKEYVVKADPVPNPRGALSAYLTQLGYPQLAGLFDGIEDVLPSIEGMASSGSGGTGAGARKPLSERMSGQRESINVQDLRNLGGGMVGPSTFTGPHAGGGGHGGVRDPSGASDDAAQGTAQEEYTGTVAPPAGSEEMAIHINRVAKNLGIDPVDLATVISYETVGKMSPSIRGGKNNKYIGLIQFGPPEQRQYGAHQGQTFGEQMDAVERYLKDRGLKAGMGLEDLYSTINAGSPGHGNRSDRPGYTVARHAREMAKSAHRGRAQAIMGAGGSGLPGQPKPIYPAGSPLRPGGGTFAGGGASSDIPESSGGTVVDDGSRTLFPRTKDGSLHHTEAGMNPDLRERLLQMQADSPHGGARLMGPRSGSRTYQEQVDIYKTSRPGYAAKPGGSQHGKHHLPGGGAADLAYASAEDRRWYHTNAAKYGITFPMGHEPWHAQVTPGSKPVVPRERPAPARSATSDEVAAHNAKMTGSKSEPAKKSESAESAADVAAHNAKMTGSKE